MFFLVEQFQPFERLGFSDFCILLPDLALDFLIIQLFCEG
jgi:hypothetical protein